MLPFPMHKFKFRSTTCILHLKDACVPPSQLPRVPGNPSAEGYSHSYYKLPHIQPPPPPRIASLVEARERSVPALGTTLAALLSRRLAPRQRLGVRAGSHREAIPRVYALSQTKLRPNCLFSAMGIPRYNSDQRPKPGIGRFPPTAGPVNHLEPL